MKSSIPVAMIVAALTLTGCSEQTTAEVDVGPTGSPSLSLVEPTAGPDGTLCVTVGNETDFRFPLLISVEEFLLRPPGACGLSDQCGHLALYANGVLNNQGATPAIDVLFRNLADRIHDGSDLPETGLADVLTITVEAHHDDGEPVLDHDDVKLAAEIDLITVPDCQALDSQT